MTRAGCEEHPIHTQILKLIVKHNIIAEDGNMAYKTA